ncbi:Right handed beta helix region [Haloechinothrix alba]|uniref:Right handed beta helix region n=1 Tax=Haloechinothrix alba TaxID=664784 RepID=A0A238X0F8_9PSEU|nr:right-handed parallel beta-helix repeat-containing protein [Haloechinothrix alba]SNR52081.1 Right handed beta helix region [Haloechinothrix alba]
MPGGRSLTRALHTRSGIRYLALLILLVSLAAVLVLQMSNGSPVRSGTEPAGERYQEPPLAGTDAPVPDGALLVATDGADDNPGTADAPLRTLGAAIDRAEPGATIVLRDGVYRESVGMVRKRLTIRAYPGERVWFRGSTPVDDWTGNGQYWEHTGWVPDFCRDCFVPEIIDPEHPLAGRPDMVFVNGAPLRQVSGRDEVEPGTFFVDTDDPAVVIGDDPTGKLVEVATHDHLLQFDGPGAAGSTILGIGVAQYASRQDYGARSAMVVVNAPDVTVDSAAFVSSASTGLAVFQPGAIVTGTRLGDNGLVGLLANRADGLVMTGNTVTGNNLRRFTLSGEAIGAAGTKITRTARPHIARNTFTGNLATGWWCDLGCTDATVVHNVSADNLRHGLYYEVSSRALIASNALEGNGGAGLKISSSDDIGVYHNTFAGNELSTGIYNDPRSPESDPYSAGLGLTWVTENVRLVNNYITQRVDDRPIIDAVDGKDDPAGNPPFVSEADGNAYLWSSSDEPGHLLTLVMGDGERSDFTSLAELRETTGFERSGSEHELAASLLSPFVDPGNGDFSLRADAPGRRAGVPIPHDVAAELGIAGGDTPVIGVLPRP